MQQPKNIHNVKLLVDDRERGVVQQLQKYAPQSIIWEVARLSNGDFSIISQPTNDTLTFIERKTYSDFAQSIKDGRMENVARMLELARTLQPQPRIAILLEGDAPTHVAGISLKCIRAKINHLWLRDDVYLIQTQDEAETAQYLISLTESAQTLKPMSSATIGAAPAACIPVAPQTIEQIALAMFMQMPKIGRARAQKFIDSGQSIADFICSERTTYDTKCDIDILTTIKGMSSERARALLTFANGMQQLINMPPDALANFKYNNKSQTILVQRAYDALHYRAK